MKRAALTLLSLYQRTRIFRPQQCRFYPSCSTYTAQAIEKHGLSKGLLLGSWRLLRCQPLHPGGVEEVPERLGEAFRIGLNCRPASGDSGVLPMPARVNGETGLYNCGSKEETAWT